MDILISGASTGIGRAAAVHLARLGHTVWAGVRSAKAFETIERLNVSGLKPIELDVTDGASVTAALHRVKKESGMLHVLINNAGIVVGGPVEGLPIAKWREQFDVNFFGAVELTKACLPSLRESKGRIINMSSISGRIASPFLGPYAASKFALEAFSDSLRRELAPHAVKVVIIEPGPIDTPIWRKSAAKNRSLLAEYSDEIREIYQRALEAFAKSVEQAELSAAPVTVVLRALEHAVNSPTPQTRYAVGKGVYVKSQLAHWLPDTWVDRLLQVRLK